MKPEDFKKLEDIARFPFIDKKDLMKDQEANPPFGRRMCVPFSKVRRVNLTSGTSGMGQELHCHDERAIWAANASTAAHFAAIGLKKGDFSAVLLGQFIPQILQSVAASGQKANVSPVFVKKTGEMGAKSA